MNNASTRGTGDLSSAPTTAHEAQRRFAVNLVFFVYILTFIEGSLRKWFAPEFGTLIYFLRDPVVLFLYAYCLHARLINFNGWAKLWFVFAALTSAVGIIPYMLESVDPRAWMLGVRTYWLYMPLAFVIASTFQRSDLMLFLRWNIILAIPYAALIIAQYRSPPYAWINAGIGGDEGVVTISRDMVRPNGLFTYTGQNVNFSASLIAIFIAYVVVKGVPTKSWLLCFIAAGPVACLSVLSGSRTIYFFAAASILLTLAGLNLMKARATGILMSLFIACCVALAAVLFVHVFSDAYEAMQDRFERAERSEGPIQNRAIGNFLSFLWPLETAPILGHGIGLGAPPVNRFLNRPHQEFGEADLMRNVNELGIVLGLVFVMFRFAFAAHLVIVSLRAARTNNPEFLPLAAFAALGISGSAITNSTLNGFSFWLAAGLALSATQITDRSSLRASSVEPVLKKGGQQRARPKKPTQPAAH